MNQILYVSGGKTSGPLPVKTVARFFAIAIIIFGFLSIGQAAYALFFNDESMNANIDNTIPEITFSRDQNNVTLTLRHNKGINIIKYWWNDDIDNAKIESGGSKREVVLSDIPIPSQVNTLHVTATDDNGKEANSSHEFSYDGIAFDFDTVDNTYLKITASDVNGMQYMTYRWNNSEEVMVYPDEDGAIAIEVQTEIPIGLNTLHIQAVNSENVSLNWERSIRGNKKPEITWYLMGEDIYITVTDAEGIVSITQQLNVNDVETIYPIPDTQNNPNLEYLVTNDDKEIQYKYHIGKENVLITIEAEDIYTAKRTLKGKNY